MEYKKNKQTITIRLDDGDEIIGSLKAIGRKEKITGASIMGLGAAKLAELSHYDSREKKYNTKRFEGMLEIISLNGNMAMQDGEIAIHIHMSISKEDFSTVSGHLMSGIIYPNCEIVLNLHDIKIERRFDEKTGLNLQRF
ncbi:DNA-binding protein [Candidatus Micrarchaeota archaeon]|nr:DNA-binding protein [Candidatus Micrarchaeota archaeon]